VVWDQKERVYVLAYLVRVGGLLLDFWVWLELVCGRGSVVLMVVLCNRVVVKG